MIEVIKERISRENDSHNNGLNNAGLEKFVVTQTIEANAKVVVHFIKSITVLKKDSFPDAACRPDSNICLSSSSGIATIEYNYSKNMNLFALKRIIEVSMTPSFT